MLAKMCSAKGLRQLQESTTKDNRVCQHPSSRIVKEVSAHDAVI